MIEERHNLSPAQVTGMPPRSHRIPLDAPTMKTFISILCFAAFASISAADDQDTVLPGRKMSEHQVVDLACRQLPQVSEMRCEFKDGVWNVLEVQKGVWGVSSLTTNSDGKVFIPSTNATRLVLRVSDADGKVEPVNPP